MFAPFLRCLRLLFWFWSKRMNASTGSHERQPSSQILPLSAQNFVEKQDGFCQTGRQLGGMNTKTAIISIENIKSADIPTLRQALAALPGVETIDFSVERSVAVIEFDPGQSHIDDFLRAVLKAGFKVL
jgi:copper chaperone CopZ